MKSQLLFLQLLIVPITISYAQEWKTKVESPAGITNTQPPAGINEKIYFLSGKDYIHDKLLCYNIANKNMHRSWG